MTDELIEENRPPFAMVPSAYLNDPTLSDRALRHWLILQDHSGMDERIFPGWDRLAVLMSCHRSTVYRTQLELVDRGMLRVESGKQKGSSNRYFVIWPLSHPRDVGVSPTRRGGVSPTRHKQDLVFNKKQTPSRTGATDRFDDFWKAYPLKVKKLAARKSWDKSLKLAKPEVIIKGAIRYRDDPNRKPQYTSHPTTWLNAGSWMDVTAEVVRVDHTPIDSGLFNGGRVSMNPAEVTWR